MRQRSRSFRTVYDLAIECLINFVPLENVVNSALGEEEKSHKKEEKSSAHMIEPVGLVVESKSVTFESQKTIEAQLIDMVVDPKSEIANGEDKTSNVSTPRIVLCQAQIYICRCNCQF